MFEILAMALFVRVITPSTKPVEARKATAQWNEVTVPNAAVNIVVTKAEISIVFRKPIGPSPARPQA